MDPKQVALGAAAFLDSPQAQALAGPSREELRKIVVAFLSVCFSELGKQPNLLDGHDLRAALGERMPTHFAPRDPLAEHVPAVLAAYLEHLKATQVVNHAFEIAQALEESTSAFLDSVRSGRNAHLAPATRQSPRVHQAPKLGRNDPCFCGSGKKFKKCHGRGA